MCACLAHASLARPHPNISAEGLHFSAPSARMRRRVTVLGLCVCVSVCPAPRVLPLRATERPTEGIYGFGAIWETFKKIFFLRFVQKLWREKANKLISMCLQRHHMAPMERHFARNLSLFWFFQSLTAGYKLPGIVRQRATSLSAVQFVYTGLLLL